MALVNVRVITLVYRISFDPCQVDSHTLNYRRKLIKSFIALFQPILPQHKLYHAKRSLKALVVVIPKEWLSARGMPILV